ARLLTRYSGDERRPPKRLFRVPHDSRADGASGSGPSWQANAVRPALSLRKKGYQGNERRSAWRWYAERRKQVFIQLFVGSQRFVPRQVPLRPKTGASRQRDALMGVRQQVQNRLREFFIA